MKVWDEQVRTEACSQRDELVMTGVSWKHLASIWGIWSPICLTLCLFVWVGNLTILEHLLLLPPEAKQSVYAPLQLFSFPSRTQHVLLRLPTPHLRSAWPAEGKLVGGDEAAKMGESGREDELSVCWSQFGIPKSCSNHSELGRSVL